MSSCRPNLIIWAVCSQPDKSEWSINAQHTGQKLRKILVLPDWSHSYWPTVRGLLKNLELVFFLYRPQF